MDLEIAIEKVVARKVQEILHEQGLLENYQKLSVLEAAEMCGVSKSIIQDLVNNREETGFPGAKLGPKTFVIDRVGFISWLDQGGLLKAASKTKENAMKLGLI